MLNEIHELNVEDDADDDDVIDLNQNNKKDCNLETRETIAI